MFNLAELLRQHEGKTLEFKRDLSSPDKVMRSLVAFANGAGGVLLIVPKLTADDFLRIDDHMRPRGHRTVARAIADALR